MSLLSDILRTKLIPWSQQNIGKRFIVARPRMIASKMPEGVQLSPCDKVGPRVIAKKARYYKNTRGVIANWPKGHLNEVTVLKLICVISGHINFQLGNYLVQCGPGHFIFIPPGMPHPDSSFSYVDTAKGNFCDILYFQLLPHAVHCWIDRSKAGQPMQKESNFLILDEHIVMLFRILMEKVFTVEKDLLLVTAELLPIFLQLLQSEICQGHFQIIRGDNPDDFFQKVMSDKQNEDFATRLEYYVQANLHKQLTLEKVSREMYFSRTQFTVTVRRETGQSFNQFLMAHRMETAKQALLDSQWTISAISTFVGFKSPSYFRTAFRKYTGKTPTQFRVQSRQSKPR